MVYINQQFFGAVTAEDIINENLIIITGSITNGSNLITSASALNNYDFNLLRVSQSVYSVSNGIDSTAYITNITGSTITLSQTSSLTQGDTIGFSTPPGTYFFKSASFVDPNNLLTVNDISGSNLGKDYAVIAQAQRDNTLITGRFHLYTISEVTHRSIEDSHLSFFVEWGEPYTEAESGDVIRLDGKNLAIVDLTNINSLSPEFSREIPGMENIPIGSDVAAWNIALNNYLDSISTSFTPIADFNSFTSSYNSTSSSFDSRITSGSGKTLGLIKIVDKAGDFFTDLATASAYIRTFTSATITDESYSNGTFWFTVPNGSSFALSTFFLGKSAQNTTAYIEDTLGLITTFGSLMCYKNNGDNILLNSNFGATSFQYAGGNNTFRDCTFSVNLFTSSTGTNIFRNCTFGNSAFESYSGIARFQNILLSNPSNIFAPTSSGRFEIYGTIGTTTGNDYANFFPTNTAVIWARKVMQTNNAGGIEGDLARAQTNGAKLFFGYAAPNNLNVAFTDIVNLGSVTGAVSIDWALGVKHKLNLSGNVTITQTNYAAFEGQKVQEIQITSSSPDYTITWVDVNPADFTDTIDFTTGTTYNNVSVRLLRSNIFQSNNLVR